VMSSPFFRDPEALRSLLGRLEELLRGRGPDASLRVWVSGCGTGEEAYTIAILCEEARRAARSDAELRIFATDDRADLIGTARRGVYGRAAAAGVPADLFAACFAPDGEDVRVVPAVRERVHFSVHDLAGDPPFAHLDLIACRGALADLAPDARQSAEAALHYALRPGGLLLAGPGEVFTAVPPWFAPGTAPGVFERLADGGAPAARPAGPPAAGWRSGAAGAADALRRLVVEKCAALACVAAFAIDGDDGVRFSLGAAAAVTALRHGPPSHAITDLVDETLAGPLRRALARVRRTGEPAELAVSVPAARPAGPRLVVHPFPELGEAAVLLLALPEAAVAPGPAGATDAAAAADGALLAEIAELRAEAAELRSAKEELRVLGDELHTRLEALQADTDTLIALGRGIAVPALIVGRDLRVRGFTPELDRVCPLADVRVGDSLLAIRWRTPPCAELRERLHEVIASGVTATVLVEAGEASFEARLSPVRTIAGAVDGAVVAFTDVTGLKRGLAEAERRREIAVGMLAALDEGLIKVDPRGLVEFIQHIGDGDKIM